MKAETRRRVRSRIAPPLGALFKVLTGTVSWSTAQKVGHRLGSLIWRFGRRDRERTLAHLELAFPDLSETERSEIGRRATQSIGVSIAEYFHLAHRGPEAARPQLQIEGWEHVESARRKSPLIMIATGHCGNWELLGPTFHSKGELLTGLVRTLEDAWTEASMTRFRRRLGSVTIQRSESDSATKLLSLRRRGGYLLALIDQDIRAQSVYVPFFGRLAHTPVGPAQLALRWSMPVVPAFCRRLEDGRHQVRFEPALPTFEDATELTAAITAAIEAQIRRQPDQWVWMHRRWRRQLPDDTEFLARGV